MRCRTGRMLAGSYRGTAAVSPVAGAQSQVGRCQRPAAGRVGDRSDRAVRRQGGLEVICSSSATTNPARLRAAGHPASSNAAVCRDPARLSERVRFPVHRMVTADVSGAGPALDPRAIRLAVIGNCHAVPEPGCLTREQIPPDNIRGPQVPPLRVIARIAWVLFDRRSPRRAATPQIQTFAG